MTLYPKRPYNQSTYNRNPVYDSYVAGLQFGYGGSRGETKLLICHIWEIQLEGSPIRSRNKEERQHAAAWNDTDRCNSSRQPSFAFPCCLLHWHCTIVINKYRPARLQWHRLQWHSIEPSGYSDHLSDFPNGLSHIVKHVWIQWHSM